MMDSYGKIFGYYLSDIGIIGEFILYGIFYVVAEMMILFKMAFTSILRNFSLLNT